MYKKGIYRESDSMGDLICGNYPMLLVMGRFGIALGFKERNIGEVCRQNGVDTKTFLAVVNFLAEGIPVTDFSLEALIEYLHNAHDYFLNFRLPRLRTRLGEALTGSSSDVSFAICKFFDEYISEVHKHMSYEEKTVFPYVRSLLSGQKKDRYNISIFTRRHDQIEMKMMELKNLLIKYYSGTASDNLNSVLYGIFATEDDLASHNRVENRLFIPAIRNLETAVDEGGIPKD
jgi:regulator of cell morphogenesis and NO signaling